MRFEHWFYTLPLRLRSLFRRRQVEQELDEELRYHIERQIEEHVAKGLTPEEARDAALRAMGGVERRKEECRDARHVRLIEDLMQDLRFGLRTLRKNPGFTAVAVLTLALGIGANTAMFSAVDAVLIRPLPYADAERLVMIWDEMSNIGFPKHNSTPAEWREWGQNNTVFTDIAATQPVQAILSGDGEPEEVPARKVTPNLWPLLGARPLLGRVFNEDEDARGSRVAVISYGLWRRRFGGSPDALGRKITLNDSPYEVIGVMPREFYFLPARDIDIWMPTSFSAEMLTYFSWHDAHCVARLKPGVTLRQAKEEMRALSLRV